MSEHSGGGIAGAVKKAAREAVESFVDGGKPLNVPEIREAYDNPSPESEAEPSTREKLRTGLDRGVLSTIAEMNKLDAMGDEEKAKLVWEETRDTIGWKEGQFFGLADTIGGWITEKVIGLGLLPKSFVVAAAGKKKLREEMQRRKEKRGTSEGSGRRKDDAHETKDGEDKSPLQRLQEGVGAGIEKGKEVVESVEAKFDSIREQSKAILGEYRQLAADMGVTGAVAELERMTEAIGKMTYGVLSETTRAALGKMLESKTEPDARIAVPLLLADLKQGFEHNQIVQELRAWRMEPKEKSVYITNCGLDRLIRDLGTNKVPVERIREIEASVAPMRDKDYLSIDKRQWKELGDKLRMLDTGIELHCDRGRYHIVDFTNGFGDSVVGFEDNAEEKDIKAIPPVYFGQTTLLEWRERSEEAAEAFFGPMREVLSRDAAKFGREAKSPQALKELEDDYRSGKISITDLLIRPVSGASRQRMDGLARAIAEDCRNGILAIGITATTVAIASGANTFWYVVKTSFAAPLQAMLAGGKQVYEHADLKAGLRAGTVEYLKTVSPFISFYAGREFVQKALTNPAELFSATSLKDVVLAAGAGVALPGTVIAITAGGAWSVGKKLLRFGASDNKLEVIKLHLDRTVNHNYLRHLPNPTRWAFGKMRSIGELPNVYLLEDIADTARRLKYLEALNHASNQVRFAGRMRELTTYSREVEHATKELEALVQRYIRSNFSAKTIIPKLISKIGEQLMESVAKNEGHIWLTAGFMRDFERQLDILILREGKGLTKILGNTLYAEEELLSLQARRSALPSGHAEIATLDARIAAVSAEIANNTTVNGRIQALRAEFDAGMKQASPDRLRMRQVVRELDLKEKQVIRQYSANLDALSGSSLDVRSGIQAMEEGAHSNQVIGGMVKEHAARAKRFLQLNPDFADEAARMMEETDVVLAEYNGKVRSLAEKITKEYSVLKRAATGSGEKLALREAYRKLMLGGPGSNRAMQLFKHASGRLKFGILLSGIMAGVSGVAEAMKDDGERDFSRWVKEQGPEMLDMIVAVLPVAGFTSDFSSAWQGKSVITGRNLSTAERWGKFGWGVTGLAMDTITLLGISTAWTGVGAGVAGGGMATKVAAALLRFGVAAPRAAKMGTAIGGFIMKLGPGKMMKVITGIKEEFKVASQLGAKALGRTALRTTASVGMASMVTYEGARLVYGLYDDDPGFQAGPDALEALRDDNGKDDIPPFPPDGQVEQPGGRA